MSRKVLLFVLIVGGLGTLLTLPALSKAQPVIHRAGLVIQFADHQTQTACVSFPENEISGLDLLARSNIPYIAQQSGMGAAICKIGDAGCSYPAQDCFCQCQGAQCIYWTLYLQ